MSSDHEVNMEQQGPPPAYQPYASPSGYPQPQSEYFQPQQPGYPQQSPGNYYPPPPPPGPTVITTQPTNVVMQMTGGDCPHCHAGFLVKNFTACGIIWAVACGIFLCPFGLICLFTMRERKCGMCGFVVP